MWTQGLCIEQLHLLMEQWWEAELVNTDDHRESIPWIFPVVSVLVYVQLACDIIRELHYRPSACFNSKLCICRHCFSLSVSPDYSIIMSINIMTECIPLKTSTNISKDLYKLNELPLFYFKTDDVKSGLLLCKKLELTEPFLFYLLYEFTAYTFRIILCNVKMCNNLVI